MKIKDSDDQQIKKEDDDSMVLKHDAIKLSPTHLANYFNMTLHKTKTTLENKLLLLTTST